MEVILLAKRPPVQDSATEILRFFLINFFNKIFIKLNSYLKS